MGLNTLKVPMTLHKQNRDKLMARFVNVPAKSLIFLKGGDDQPIFDSDIDQNFKQESSFQYVFGVKEPGCMGILDLASHKVLHLYFTEYITR